MFFFLAATFGGGFAYKFISDDDAMHEAALSLARTQKEEDIRDYVITPKIQKELEILLYSLHADRTYLIELHNGKKNTTGLPFRYMDVSYEITNDESKATKIGMQYQSVPTTLYKFPYYLQENKFFIGSIDDFKKVDVDLGKSMEGNQARYIALVALNSDGISVGYLGITWCDMMDLPSNPTIEKKLLITGKALSQLLDLRKQMIDD
jgi:hypothetical protein